MTRTKWSWKTLTFFLLLICGGCLWWYAEQEEKLPENVTENSTDREVTPQFEEAANVQKVIQRRDKAASILREEAEYSLFCSCVSEPGFDLTIHDDVAMRSASMIKVFILGCAMEMARDGLLDLGDYVTLRNSDKVGGSGILAGYPDGMELSVLELLRLMITESNNTATNIIIDRLGMETINRYMARHGYVDSILQRKMMDFDAADAGRENYTSARDLGTFFVRLYHHQCVSAIYDGIMIEILKAQTDDEALPAALPNYAIAHKTGELAGAYHDGGILYGEQEWVLVILTDDYNSRDGAIEATRRTAKYLIVGP